MILLNSLIYILEYLTTKIYNIKHIHIGHNKKQKQIITSTNFVGKYLYNMKKQHLIIRT